MGTLVQLSQNLKILQNRNTFYAEVLRIASQFEAYLIDLNQLQLSRGENISGEVIGTYSENTESFASRESTVQPKEAGANYNFEWTGELFAGMFLKITSEYIEIFSTAPHASVVVDTYSNLFGENVIFGLNSDHMVEFVQKKLTPQTQTYVSKVLNL